MSSNLLQTADFLRDKLREYYQVLRRDGTDNKEAIERLRRALRQVEPLLPSDSVEQVETALEERWLCTARVPCRRGEAQAGPKTRVNC
jgi:hypothetical protein